MACAGRFQLLVALFLMHGFAHRWISEALVFSTKENPKETKGNSDDTVQSTDEEDKDNKHQTVADPGQTEVQSTEKEDNDSKSQQWRIPSRRRGRPKSKYELTDRKMTEAQMNRNEDWAMGVLANVENTKGEFEEADFAKAQVAYAEFINSGTIPASRTPSTPRNVNDAGQILCANYLETMQVQDQPASLGGSEGKWLRSSAGKDFWTRGVTVHPWNHPDNFNVIACNLGQRYGSISASSEGIPSFVSFYNIFEYILVASWGIEPRGYKLEEWAPSGMERYRED